MMNARKTALEVLLLCEDIVRPAADLTLLVGLDYTDVEYAKEEPSTFGTDQPDMVDWILKTMSEAEVSSSDHPGDVVTTGMNGVLARADLVQAPMKNAVYMNGAREVKPAKGYANLPIESPTAMIHEELRPAGRLPAVDRWACRLDQGLEYQEA